MTGFGPTDRHNFQHRKMRCQKINIEANQKQSYSILFAIVKETLEGFNKPKRSVNDKTKERAKVLFTLL